MKLQKWQCGTCGFEWFESAEVNRRQSNINHGCPQECDDAGKIIDTVEATHNRDEWICWVLSKADIELIAKKVGVNSRSLTEDNCDDIARSFIKGFEWANENWALILEDAIEDTLR